VGHSHGILFRPAQIARKSEAINHEVIGDLPVRKQPLGQFWDSAVVTLRDIK
jgi:hypothetical protein